ncbi:multidrug ABC transporter ATP-binding protein [Clostridia bacterium]|nr:multidrug ABC transporter ATP-binding protein [Clostridia bacterium]
MLVNLNKIYKFYNGVQILKNINLTIQDNDRIGLIGNNGCGKSTLLRILTGVEQPDATIDTEGIIVTNCNVGFLMQSGTANTISNNNVFDEMKEVFSPLLDAFSEMKFLEKDLTAENTKKYADLSAYFEANDGYNIDVKIKTVLSGMGFPPNTYERAVSSFSGGEQTRLSIAKLLLLSPALLILDEPTNHLDFKTINWLEDYLKTYKGALLIVSHDRYFLDRLCTSICEIENSELTRYKGNYSAFVKLKEDLVTRKIKEYEAQQEQIAKMEEYVAKNITRASTSKSAKSRVKALERMDYLEKPQTYYKPPKLQFEYNIEPPLEVLKVFDLAITIGEKTLVENVLFELRRGERLAIIGENGTGKSTMLKLITKRLPLIKGRVKWADNTKISFYEQENTALNPNNTVLSEIHSKFPHMNDVDIRSLLGKVRITGENVFKKIGVISGGERAKVRFAVMVLEKGNVLILDEPTNHLDLTTKEVLENALIDYTGTIIFVSHDRYLVNKVATKIIELTDIATEYNGNFDFYLRTKENNNVLSKEQSKNLDVNSNAKNKSGKEQRRLAAEKRNEISRLETEIADLEEKLKILELDITKEQVYNDFKLMQEKCALIDEYKKNIDIYLEKLIECST